jgi:hypothetical protein
MMLREVLAGGKHLEPEVIDKPARILGAVQRIVARGVRDGDFRPVDPLLTHLSLVGSLVFFFATAPFRERVLATRRPAIKPPDAAAYVKHYPGFAHSRAGGSEPEREAPRMIARRGPFVIVAVLVLVGLVGFAVWRFFLAPPAIPPGVIAVSGRIEGDDSAVAAKTSGRIQEIAVREGDRLEAGQVIAVLDDEQVRAREDQATATVRQAEARARLAEHHIAVLEEQLRQSRLGVDQARADAEGRVNEAEGRLAAAEAQLAQAQAAYAQAKWDREAMARLSGRIGARRGKAAHAHSHG